MSPPPRRPALRKPRLTVPQILAWADEFHHRQQCWPNRCSGRISFTEESWREIDSALKAGCRGLPRGTSLAKLLSRRCGVPHRANRSELSETKILRWAKTHYRRTGRWPIANSGPVDQAPSETWSAINEALIKGRRNLPRGSSLATLLAAWGVKRNRKRPSTLTIRQILHWADEFHVRHGAWPDQRSGPVQGTVGETWRGIDNTLRHGMRGLSGRSSLPRFLNKYRRIFNGLTRRPTPVNPHKRLQIEQIVKWGEAHRRLTGTWPTRDSGLVRGTSWQSWKAIDAALNRGQRGLPGGSSLPKLFGDRVPSN